MIATKTFRSSYELYKPEELTVTIVSLLALDLNNLEICFFCKGIKRHGALEFRWVFNQNDTLLHLSTHAIFMLFGKYLDAQLAPAGSRSSHIFVIKPQYLVLCNFFHMFGNLLKSGELIGLVQNDMPIPRRLFAKILVLWMTSQK
jgi:hypothetical protein